MNPYLKPYIDLIPFLANTLSASYEIVLFDTTAPELPVAAHSSKDQENIRATRELIRELLRNEVVCEQGQLCNRPLVVTEEILLKCSIYFIHGDEEQIAGALCVNMQCNTYMKLHEIIGGLLQFDYRDIGEESVKEPQVSLQSSEEEPSLEMIDRIVKEYNVAPGRLTQDERIDLMCTMYDSRIFSLKGAVAKVAEVLEVSEQSVYRYLSKIRKMRA